MRAALLAAACAIAGCGSRHAGDSSSSAPSSGADERIVEELRRFEAERRAAADFATAPPSDDLFGPDPYAVRALPGGRFAGILRGAGALVLLDREAREIARAPIPNGPSGLAFQDDTLFVVAERSSAVHPFRVEGDQLVARPTLPLPGVRAARDIAAGPGGALHVVEEAEGRLLTLVPDPASPGGYDISTRPFGRGAFRVARTRTTIVVANLLEHTITISRVDARGRPTEPIAVLRNDGPLWSFAPLEGDGFLLVASGGVEDKPLDRTHGSFENIDSFVYVDRIELAAAPAQRVTRLHALDVAEHGVIVPKALHLAENGSAFALTATGFGGDAYASIHFANDTSPPLVTRHPLPPGTAHFTHDERGDLLIANPLLDAWIRTSPAGPPIVPVPDPARSARTPASRLGEALIFTTLIAPWNRSNGPLSRFTCETCHFEGYGDGRTHSTGRGDVRATTKPLLGLFNNRPHFSRALDPDLSIVAHSEFRVAGARSDHDPVFDLPLADAPWLEHLGVTQADLDAVSLRRAFMTFLMEWTHRRNALTAGRAAFSDVERRGATVFRDLCETCHEARLQSDVPTSRAPFETWEAHIFSEPSPLVWGQAKYAKTGPSPYVHEEGARIPSLRRLYKKGPYFTTGAARSLADVLVRVRIADPSRPATAPFFHAEAPEDPTLRALTDDERAALEAFLLLL